MRNLALLALLLSSTVAHAQLLQGEAIILASGQPLGTFTADSTTESWDVETFLPGGTATAFELVPQAVAEHSSEFAYTNAMFNTASGTIDATHTVFEVELCESSGCEVVMYLAMEGDGAALHWFQVAGQSVDAYALQAGDSMVFTPVAAPPTGTMAVIHQTLQ